jgi:hypothetical protein
VFIPYADPWPSPLRSANDEVSHGSGMAVAATLDTDPELS